MMVDDELAKWQHYWQSEPTPEMPDLLAQVKRQSRRMRWTLAGEAAITVVIGGGTTAAAIHAGEADLSVLAAATWLFIASAWAFGLWSRHGTWSPAALNTAAYLDVTIRRCESALRNVVFGMILFWTEMLFFVGWIYHRQQSAAFLLDMPRLVIWAGTVVFCVWAIRYRRRKLVELGALRQLQDALQRAEALAGEFPDNG